MKNVTSRFASVIFMLLLCAVFGVYRLGWFDISFFVRPAETNETADTTETKPDTKKPVDTVYDTEEDVSVSTETEMTDTETEMTPDTDAENEDTEYVFMSADEADEADYERSYDEWRSNGEWILAEADITLPDYFSRSKITEYEVSYEMQEDKSPYKPVYTPYKTDKKAVTLYMGYIIMETDTEGIVNIYDSDGDVIGSYDEEKIKPAFCRDNKDRPLFLYKNAYYYLDSKKGDFIEADYIPERDSRGANFDYTPDYGDDGNDRTFLVSEEIYDVYEPIENKFDEEGFQLAYKIPTLRYLYKLHDTKGKLIKDEVYYGAYAFSDSRAAVVDEEGHLFYITRSGSVAIRTGAVRRDIELGRSVFDFYMEPITNGEESIGFYYFEHGICRVRLLSVDYYRYNKYKTVYTVSDDDLILYSNGDKFPIPTGYDVIAYSSGMILLEKDGKFGYMDYTGDWIVDPVLDYAEPFYEGLAVVGAGEGGKLRALIDTNGEYVIPAGVFSYISNASSGLLSVYGEYGWKILYKMKLD